MSSRLPPVIKCSPQAVLKSNAEVPWADTMVLNPALVQDPASHRLHMLFRASGPWPQARIFGKAMPFPIFLGYAWSDDRGASWTADWERPALAPALAYEQDRLYITNDQGRRVVNYANGCLEDPRLMWVEGELYLTVACRMFPPGPYWECDDPTQCAPAWSADAGQPLGAAARSNLTVTVLYRVDLEKVASRQYERAFAYVTHLTDPEVSDNRDAFLFPEKLTIQGKSCLVMIHRPRESERFTGGAAGPPPLMVLAAAEEWDEFPTPSCRHQILAEPCFGWEGNRIGGSFPPIKIAANQWLLGYHGKQDDVMGYTQSFMIIEQAPDQWPRVIHRCPDRLMYARQPWELEGRFKIPCVFACSGVVVDDTLIIGYGAADERVGIARVALSELVAWVRRFGSGGKRISNAT